MKTREQKTRLMLSLAIAVAFSAAGLLATNTYTQVRMVDDRTIVLDIRDELRGDPSLGHIRVECQDGVVTLSGTVKTKAEESRAIGIASAEPGVINVVSQLKIKDAAKPATPPKEAQHVASQKTTKTTKPSKPPKTKSKDSTKTSETPKP